MNQQESSTGPAHPIEDEEIPPHTIIFKVVEHLAYEAASYEKEKTFHTGHKDNSPIAGIKFKIKLPDGSDCEKTTDADGIIEIKDLPIGQKCEVTFEAEEAKLNNSYLLFYDGTRFTPENAPQNKPEGEKHRWVKKNLMVGATHLFSIFRPPVVIDSHMHIQSGRCAPMPGIWDKASVLGWFRIRRMRLENIGKVAGQTCDYVLFKPIYGWAKKQAGGEPTDFDGFYYKRNKLRKILDLQNGDTFEVGKKFVEQRRQKVYDDLKASETYQDCHLQLPCVVMTMDMEYAHIDGYFGIKIYNGVYEEGDAISAKPKRYWFPVHRGFRGAQYISSPEGCEDISYDRMDEDAFEHMQFEKELKRPLSDGKGSLTIRCVPCLVDDEETKLYEPWDKQVRYTRQVVLSNPLKLLPMYHYDPRRWQERGNNQVFDFVGQNGIYLGFKIYTAQGYRPLDRRLPILEDFYARCEARQIPIVNHATPEGNYSADRSDYIAFTHPMDTEADTAEKIPYREYIPLHNLHGSMVPIDHLYQENGRFYHYPDFAAEAYFNEHFISPAAWEKVLSRYKGLRICLAHFGGDTGLGRKWGDQILEMMAKYDNLYADISSSFAYKSFRRRFIKKLEGNELLKSRILFGTDWYLTILGPNVDYPLYFKDAKKALDEHDTSLWTQFALINPLRFFNLKSNFDRIAFNLIKLIDAPESKEPIDSTIFEKIDKEAEALKKVYEVYERIGQI